MQSQKDDFGPRISDGRSPLASETHVPQAKKNYELEDCTTLKVKIL